MSVNRYITTEKWKLIRQQALIRDKHLCQDCLINKATEVHHLTYKNFMHEKLEELISLCRVCHGKRHGRDKKIRPELCSFYPYDTYEEWVNGEINRIIENDN